MSRTFMVGILAILVCLMGVVSYLMTPKPPPVPKPPDRAQIKKMQESEMKNRQQMMKAQMARAKQTSKAGASGKQGAVKPPQPSGAMEITGDWFRQRAPGAAGLKQLQEKADADAAVVKPHLPATPPTKSAAVPD